MIVDPSEWAMTVIEVWPKKCVGLLCRHQSFQVGM